MTEVLSQKAHDLMKSNPSLFGLKFDGYVDGKIQYSEPDEWAIKKAEIDLAIFAEREQRNFEREEIACGDFIIDKRGDLLRVTIDHFGESIQAYSGSGSYYLCSHGGCSYSGTCGHLIKMDALKDTGEYKEGSCWIFHENSSGAGRGVHSSVKFKVWKEV